ncbi:MAG: hypothetical protein GY758_04835 [Fuerstiella sp.]|nr:hypothetical protein [Fuerstiella sp.]MCP4855633.1 hypothetical protein [Fuerstiella sp.]
MAEKEPVLLTILIETKRMRWLAGGISLDHCVFPLLASHDDDLAGYRSMKFDEQASFLRHRFCGALQRGCDRLWGLQKKACQFVFLTDSVFPDAPPELTTRIADHLAQWMTNPPVAFFSVGSASFDVRPLEVTRLAGQITTEFSDALELGLPLLVDAATQADQWEQVPPPKMHSN